MRDITLLSWAWNSPEDGFEDCFWAFGAFNYFLFQFDLSMQIDLSREYLSFATSQKMSLQHVKRRGSRVLLENELFKAVRRLE